LVPPERLAACGGGELALEPPELHYLRRVLRLRPGERFGLVDGAGHLWSATLAAGTARLEQPLQAPLRSEPPPLPLLQLAVALPRQDADVLLRMACELGIDRLSPLGAERSAAAAPLRPERQTAILREAVEQCERLWLPRLDPPRPAAAALAAATGPGLRLLATTRRAGLPSLEQCLSSAERAGDGPAVDRPAVVVAIGPEGGWSPAEEQAAEEAGWQPVGLGGTILRTSTAAVAAAVLLAAWRRGLALR
jgi:16S rRNA (uracil1498-N3)-methyltransferase